MTKASKSKAKWTKSEDKKLCEAAKNPNNRNDWKEIGRIVSAVSGNTRTEVQCLHRWQKVLDPALLKGPWAAEEDAKVLELVRLHGAKKWSTIAAELPGRIGKQCRERWHNHLCVAQG